MRERQLTRLFLRFRDRHDGRALARVFEAKARELLGVAFHLVGDAQEAEDLVQETFLAAIEGAARFERGRDLSPWLFGILCREAAKRRRRRARVVEPDRLPERASSDPHDLAVDGELHGALGSALESCPARYREVLSPLLLEGRRAEDIAREFDRSPGTVRMQIHRGLEHLRRRLPAGHRHGAMLALALPRGLPALRENVLQHAGVAAVPSGYAATIDVLGFVLSMKALKISAALLLVVPLGIWAGSSWAPAPSGGPAPATRGDEGTGTLAGIDRRDAQGRAPAVATRTEVGVSAAPDPDSARAEGEQARTPFVIECNVADRHGNPVPDAHVFFGRPLYATRARGRSDAGGRFDFEPEWDEVAVFARAEGYAPSFMHTLRRIDGESQKVRLTLPGPGADLEVLVLDEQGAPVPNAAVRLGRQARVAFLPAQSPAGDPAGNPPGNPPGERVETAPAWSLETDADGRGLFFGFAAGKQPLQVRAELFQTVPTEAVLVAGERSRMEIQVDRGQRMSGRVMTSDGRPVAGAHVAAVSLGESSTLGPRAAVSTRADDDGRYDLGGIGPVRFRAVAEHRDVGRVEEVIAVNAGEVASWNPVIVTTPGVNGRVVDERHAPLSGWNVVLHKPGETGLWHKRVTTDEDGSFEFTATPDWKFHLSVRTPRLWDEGSIVELAEVAAGDDGVMIVVPDDALPTCRLVGRIRYASGGELPKPRLMYGRVGDGYSWRAEADPRTGAFRTEPLRPGRYAIQATDAGVCFARFDEVTLSANEELDLGELVIADPGFLRATTSFSSGEPRGTLDYRVTEVGEQPRQLLDAEGDLPDVLALLPGSYELVVAGTHYKEQRAPFEIASGADSFLAVELELCTLASFELVDGAGRTLPARLTFTARDGAGDVVLEREVVANDAGEHHLELDLEPGAYRFEAEAPDGRAGGLSLHWSRRVNTSSFRILLSEP